MKLSEKFRWDVSLVGLLTTQTSETPQGAPTRHCFFMGDHKSKGLGTTGSIFNNIVFYLIILSYIIISKIVIWKVVIIAAKLVSCGGIYIKYLNFALRVYLIKACKLRKHKIHTYWMKFFQQWITYTTPCCSFSSFFLLISNWAVFVHCRRRHGIPQGSNGNCCQCWRMLVCTL